MGRAAFSPRFRDRRAARGTRARSTKRISRITQSTPRAVEHRHGYAYREHSTDREAARRLRQMARKERAPRD